MLLSLSSLEELVLSHIVIADLEYDTIYSAITPLIYSVISHQPFATSVTLIIRFLYSIY